MPSIKTHKVVAHTLVKNESRWIWYALNSVLNLVDEIMVWDTGSTDTTPDIVQSIRSSKVKFRSIGSVDAAGHTAARQSMLDETDSDWILILDGDEIWYRDSLSVAIQTAVNNPKLSAIVSPFINLVGDIYHFQNPNRSHYQIGPFKGAYNLRLINRKVPGLHVGNPHGRQEYRNLEEVALQNLSPENYLLVDKPYLHTTHLARSKEDALTLKRSFKHRHELGQSFPSDFVYPEVLYLPHPATIADPWTRRSPTFVARSLVYEPLRLAKNLIIKPASTGY